MSSTRGIITTSYLIGTVTGPTAQRALVSGSMSASSIDGPVTHIEKLDQVCYQIKWTSSNAVGTIKVQGSVNNSDFVDLTFSPALTQPNSNNGSYLINLALVPFPYIKVTYTKTSGEGDLEVWLSAKGA